MRISEEAKKLEGVADAVIAMGTKTNKEILKQLGLITKEGERATAEDMILAVKVSDESTVAGVIERLERIVSTGVAPNAGSSSYRRFFSVEAALASTPDSNFAIVSVPGRDAYEASMKLLEGGVHVQLFSDHVPIEQEIRLKEYAKRNGLLLLGPGAGTSIIGGKAIAFANLVRRGDVGIIAAAGTGLQEVSVLLDRVGLGVSEGLGVGGTDASKEVGGVMMVECLRALESDGETSLIVLVAKTPVEAVMKRIMRVVKNEVKKPVVACFLGTSDHEAGSGRVRIARTLHASVVEAARLLEAGRGRGLDVGSISMTPEALEKIADEVKRKATRGQRHVRGLYSGGTLVHESLLVYRRVVGDVYSNTPLTPKYALANPSRSRRTTILDLGDESFTMGRAHPMIDPTVRRLRLIQEARDSSVAVIMMDFILGYGSHSDPAGAMVDSIVEAGEMARERGQHLALMGHVCGTEADPQPLEGQEGRLRDAGVILFPTNLLMVIAAILATNGEEARNRVRERWPELVGR